jgi:hypothetical protein
MCCGYSKTSQDSWHSTPGCRPLSLDEGRRVDGTFDLVSPFTKEVAGTLALTIEWVPIFSTILERGGDSSDNAKGARCGGGEVGELSDGEAILELGLSDVTFQVWLPGTYHLPHEQRCEYVSNAGEEK